MKGSKKLLLVAAALLAVLVIIIVALVLAAPAIQQSVFYPKPQNLPAVVNQPAAELLARLQSVLETNAPTVAAALQPGLSEAQISQLESQGGFHLPEDLRALYRWHNGMTNIGTLGLLAGQRFVPLDEAVRDRGLTTAGASSGPAIQRAAYTVFAGHTTGWLQVLDDGAGDGYFYDPKRTDAEGAFFYHFAEEGHYLWFPSVRNFLAGVIECHESRAVKMAADGKNLDEDFERTQKVWQRLGKSSD